MMLFCEVAITFKFREKAGNILNAEVPWYKIWPWVLFYSLCSIYFLYLRFFYKYRVYKDGTYMNAELAQKQKEKSN